MARGDKRSLTPEEKKLWDYVKNGTKPLSTKRIAVEEKKPKTISQPIFSDIKFPTIPALSMSSSAPVMGNYSGIDRNTAQRFRIGEYPIDGTLDLHGMTREKAYRALHIFLKKRFERGDRCLLIITGKGVRKHDEDEVRGILKESLPQWLAEESLAPMILAFDLAKQRHGGSGAYYVLLRRKRA